MKKCYLVQLIDYEQTMPLKVFNSQEGYFKFVEDFNLKYLDMKNRDKRKPYRYREHDWIGLDVVVLEFVE